MTKVPTHRVFTPSLGSGCALVSQNFQGRALPWLCIAWHLHAADQVSPESGAGVPGVICQGRKTAPSPPWVALKAHLVEREGDSKLENIRFLDL